MARGCHDFWWKTLAVTWLTWLVRGTVDFSRSSHHWWCDEPSFLMGTSRSTERCQLDGPIYPNYIQIFPNWRWLSVSFFLHWETIPVFVSYCDWSVAIIVAHGEYIQIKTKNNLSRSGRCPQKDQHIPCIHVSICQYISLSKDEFLSLAILAEPRFVGPRDEFLAVSAVSWWALQVLFLGCSGRVLRNHSSSNTWAAHGPSKWRVATWRSLQTAPKTPGAVSASTRTSLRWVAQMCLPSDTTRPPIWWIAPPRAAEQVDVDVAVVAGLPAVCASPRIHTSLAHVTWRCSCQKLLHQGHPRASKSLVEWWVLRWMECCLCTSTQKRAGPGSSTTVEVMVIPMATTTTMHHLFACWRLWAFRCPRTVPGGNLKVKRHGQTADLRSRLVGHWMELLSWALSRLVSALKRSSWMSATEPLMRPPENTDTIWFLRPPMCPPAWEVPSWERWKTSGALRKGSPAAALALSR